MPDLRNSIVGRDQDALDDAAENPNRPLEKVCAELNEAEESGDVRSDSTLAEGVAQHQRVRKRVKVGQSA